MKTCFTALTVSLLSFALAGGVSAQTTTRPTDDSKVKRDTTTPRAPDAERTTWTPQATALESSKLIGMKVRTTEGEDVGQIDQVVVNQADGKITHAIVNKGGVLGFGAEKLVLSWSAIKLQHDVDDPDRWAAVVDQAKLDRAPKYEARSADAPPAASPATTPSTKPSDVRKKR
jgi:sporulation protein YlmC with PRC-barrel domain